MTFMSIIIICIDDILCIVGDVPQAPSIIAGMNVTEEVDGRGLGDEGSTAFIITSSELLLRDSQGIFAIRGESKGDWEDGGERISGAEWSKLWIYKCCRTR